MHEDLYSVRIFWKMQIIYESLKTPNGSWYSLLSEWLAPLDCSMCFIKLGHLGSCVYLVSQFVLDFKVPAC